MTKPIKTRFLDFVLLTPEEFQKLKDKFGEKNTNGLLENLNNYIGSMGFQHKYKSHYHVILTWAKKADKTKFEHVPEKPVQPRKPQVDSPEVHEKRMAYRKLLADYQILSASPIDKAVHAERKIKAKKALDDAIKNASCRKLGDIL